MKAHFLFQDSIQDISHWIWLSCLSSFLWSTTASFHFSLSLLMTFTVLGIISGHSVERPAVWDSLMSSHDLTGVTGFGEGYRRGEVPFLHHLMSGGTWSWCDIMKDVGRHHSAGYAPFLHSSYSFYPSLLYSLEANHRIQPTLGGLGREEDQSQLPGGALSAYITWIFQYGSFLLCIIYAY